MRTILIAAVALSAPLSVEAADVAATSKIDAVTVFPAGAEVTRSAKVQLAAGEHTIILTDLPPSANPSSIRVEGRATGRLEIGSVDSRILSIPRTDAALTATERKRIETEIETLKDAKTVLNSQVQTAEAQKALITNLIALPTRPAPAAGAAAQPENWPQLLALIGTSTADVQKVILETQIKMREVDRKIADLQKKLGETAPALDQRLEVKVFASAGAALDADLVIRYQVGAAGWQPQYDARLATGTKATAPKLSLTRRATIMQRSGEPWENVAVTLSTARPSASSAAPILQPMTVDFQSERPPMPMSAAPAPLTRSMAEPVAGVADELAQEGGRKLRAAAKQDVQQTAAQVEASPFQALYVLPGQLTIASTGEPKRVVIDNADMEPALVVRATPKVEAKAYLYAKLTLPKGTPYLPGQVALFRDQTFVGNGRLPILTPGEEHELGFGPDDAVRIKHASVDEKRSESGIITSSRNDARNFRITMQNKHERPIAIIITDQVPVSNNQEIKVEMVAKPQPTKRDVDDKRGVLAWEDTLKPEEEKVIDFGYKLSWPVAKQIIYGR
jgi:uncharacterized protein (TIGR02231 family)